ncbi:MAG: hypothetical protein WB239_05945, partial [Acidimicrobiia bacterium]
MRSRPARAGLGVVVVAMLVLGLAPITRGAEEEGGQERLACTDVEAGWGQLALTGHPLSGHYSIQNEDRAVQVFVYDAPGGGKLVNWKSDRPINAVILRSGQDAAVYEYEPPDYSATGLMPPLRDREGRNLAAILFCYEFDEQAVSLVLRLTDSKDPVSVGDEFDYVIEASASSPVADAVLVVTLPPQVTIVDAPGCEVEGQTVLCGLPPGGSLAWSGVISVRAGSAGDAVATAGLRALMVGEEAEASAREVTRIVSSEGGGCGGHEEEDEECSGGGGHDLAAVCTALDPSWKAVVLPGPFAARRYLVRGEDGTLVWVTVGESTGGQTASWSANVPIDAALARTGQDVEVYRYDYPTFFAAGLTAPAGEGGGSRPFADLGFCYQPRAEVDLWVTPAAAPSMEVGRTTVLTAVIANRGYRDAGELEVSIFTSDNLELRSCAGGDAPNGTCRLGNLEAGGRLELGIGIGALDEGRGSVTIEVRSPRESASTQDDNVA